MLAFIRCITIFIYFLLINCILILVCICRPFHRNNVYFGAKLYSSVSKLLGLEIEVRVPDSFEKDCSYIYIANHQNSFDLLTICAAVMPGTVSVGKKSLVWIPIFGWVYWLSGNILIDRKNKNHSRETLDKTVQKMRDKALSVWFFPEGTRSYGRGLLPFKTGAFRIAKATNQPIVTVSASELHNKIKLNRWSNGRFIVEIGQPEYLNEHQSMQQNAAYFHQKMSDNINRLNKEITATKGA